MNKFVYECRGNTTYAIQDKTALHQLSTLANILKSDQTIFNALALTYHN